MISTMVDNNANAGFDMQIQNIIKQTFERPWQNGRQQYEWRDKYFNQSQKNVYTRNEYAWEIVQDGKDMMDFCNQLIQWIMEFLLL